MKLNIKLDPWQEKFINTKGDKILACGRQVGKSVICGIDAGEWAVHNPNKTILMIAPTERQAFALYQKVLAHILNNYSNQLLKGKDKPTKTHFKLKNGTQVWCLPTGLSGVGIRFLTVGRLYADEASRIPRDVWTAVLPMLLTTGGEQVYLSTFDGDDNEFYECWENKEQSYNSFKRFSITSYDAITKREICKTWTIKQRDKAIERLKQDKLRMSAQEYAQEYEAIAAKDITQFFSDDIIKKSIIKEDETRPFLTDMYLGVDVAGMGRDDNVLIDIGIKNDVMWQKDISIRNKQELKDTYKEIKQWDANKNYNEIGVDDGGLGLGVYQFLKDDEQTKRKTKALNNSARWINKYKNKSKKLLKEDMYVNLLAIMEQGLIKLNDDRRIINSLRSIRAERMGNTLKIYGKYTHIAEALIRAVWLAKNKPLNIWIC